MLSGNIINLVEILKNNTRLLNYLLTRPLFFTCKIDKILLLELPDITTEKIGDTIDIVLVLNQVFIFYTENYLGSYVLKITVLYYEGEELIKETVEVPLKCSCCMKHDVKSIINVETIVNFESMLTRDEYHIVFDITVSTERHLSLLTKFGFMLHKLNVKSIH